jgi:RimJ/RimL family protein N-acetyltransferase
VENDSCDGHLTTARMVLRRLTGDDAGLLYELDGDPEVMTFLSRERTPYEFIRDQKLPALLRIYELYPGYGRWAAHDRSSHEFLGWFSLDVDAPEMVRRPELGYRLHVHAWGRGLATEGGLVLIDHAFGRLGVDAVFAQTMAVNVQSRRVMEKLGMHHIRTFHVEFDDPLPGTEHGEVEYEITRRDWCVRRHMTSEGE